MAKTALAKTKPAFNVRAGVQALVKSRVLVGITQQSASRPEGVINNADLLYLHTFGSPMQNIPERPVIVPALLNRENKEKYLKQLISAAQAAVTGDGNEMQRRLALAGLQAQNSCKEWFVNPLNNWAPNSPATIKRKGSDRPLIDTTELRNHIVYVVEAQPLKE